ncbi:hypothetical protein Syun_029423 [Stephania yunnanensis]|uniref:Uncharacterized protein n=1 Tax=Stephania yunnanensis TaxID=152371 RepID=A0AAP0HHA3_9MAGN
MHPLEDRTADFQFVLLVGFACWFFIELCVDGAPINEAEMVSGIGVSPTPASCGLRRME